MLVISPRETASPTRSRSFPAALLLVTGMLVISTTPAQSQEYSRFLKCTGTMVDGEKSYPAHIEYALRVNSRMALIQKSNVLPVGQSMSYVPTPVNYTMTYKLRSQGTQIIAASNWFYTTFLVLYPDLTKLNEIRISIDRHSGALEGQLLNEQAQLLASLDMACQSMAADMSEPPKL